MLTLQQVIITTDNVDVGTVDNQENVEPDNRKDPARFYFICHFILVTLTPTTRMTDLELKRRNRRESNQIQKTQEGMVSVAYCYHYHRNSYYGRCIIKKPSRLSSES